MEHNASVTFIIECAFHYSDILGEIFHKQKKENSKK